MKSLWKRLAVCCALVAPLAPQGLGDQVLYVSTTQGRTLHVYNLAETTGELAVLQTVDLDRGIGPLALSPDGTRLYGAAGAKPGGPRGGGIQTFKRDPKTGRLVPLGFASTGHFPTYLDVSSNGDFLVAAYYGPGLTSSYRVTTDGVDGTPISELKTDKNAHASLLNEDGYFFVPHTGPNTLHQFRLDSATGKITKNNPPVVTAGPSREMERKPVQGPRHYTYHPTLEVVYVVNELDCSVSAYRFDPRIGTLGERFQDLPTMPNGFPDRATCADIHVTPNGRFVYATTRGHDTIAGYAIDQKSGEMTPIGLAKTDPWPREFDIDLTGQYIYVAGQNAAAMRAYKIDQESGELSVIGQYKTSEKPSWVLATGVE